MKKHILCFGDSNTHGFCRDFRDSETNSGRYSENERWTCLLQRNLGEDYYVIEEGLNGRTTCFEDPLKEGMRGLDYIGPCLVSHKPVDLLIIMLGTNDVKDRYGASAACVAMAMDRLVRKAMAEECWEGKKPNILVIAPLPIGEGILNTPFVQTMGSGCVEKSRELAKYYKIQCDCLGVHFLDATDLGCEYNDQDYMHLTKEGHRALAQALACRIPGLLQP